MEKAIDLIVPDKGTWVVAWGDVMRHQKVEGNIQDSVLHIPDFLTPKPARQKLNYVMLRF